VRDAEHPARELPLDVEAREIAKRLEKRLLREILGEPAIPDDAGDQVEDRTLVAPDDLAERRLRARARVGDEPVIGERLEVERDGSRLLYSTYSASNVLVTASLRPRSTGRDNGATPSSIRGDTH
jgi:hypothetical protein